MPRPVCVALCLVLGACETDSADPPEPSLEEVTIDPGRIAMRRLSRAEYLRTMQDLLEAPPELVGTLPADDLSHGFDRVADALSISPLHVELYDQAAARVITEVFRVPLEEPASDVAVASDLVLSPSGIGDLSGDELLVWSTGFAEWTWSVPTSGRYRLSVLARAQQAGMELAAVALGADGVEVETFDVTADRTMDPEEHSVELDLREGTTTLFAKFTNDYYQPGDPTLGIPTEDRNLWISSLHIEGPVDFRPTENVVRNSLLTCDIEGSDARACAEDILRAFTPRAWRRPVTEEEIASLMAMVDEVTANGDPITWGLEFALRSVLVSPHFLFLVDDDPLAPDSYALASRLSYFLWSSMPDDTLFALAAEGQLTDPQVLREQVKRMLQDPRAIAFTEDFGAQWLHVRALDDVAPDPWIYPEFDESLRESMKGEILDFFGSFVGKDKHLNELLLSERIHIDNNLARFYGVDGLRSPGTFWSQYGLDIGRGGLLTTAGLMTALSYPTRPSPVRRGVWVLDNLLCAPPAPPPPGVEAALETVDENASLRERLEQHRSDPTCAGCHSTIDPLGFAFEHFDGVGQWRDMDGAASVDASATLPDGTTFYGARELAEILVEDPRYLACIVDKAFIWSHGRAPTLADRPALEAAEHQFEHDGATIEALVSALVSIPTFTAPQRTEP